MKCENLPFFLLSTDIACPSSRLHIIFGVGKPSALHVRLIFWFSRTATVDCVLSVSIMLGGTGKEINNEKNIHDYLKLKWNY